MTLTKSAPRRIAPLFALLCLAAAPAWADAVADVDAATASWIGAFNRKSTGDIVALYARDAVFFGTSSPVLRDKPELVLEYFKSLPSLGDATIALGEHRVQVFGDTAVSTGFYNRSSMEQRKVVISPARFSFVYAKRDGRWLIVNHHSSALP
ncbi:MAG: DUF4440 domain-containing protein [Steroidobacteraceae bacterium]